MNYLFAVLVQGFSWTSVCFLDLKCLEPGFQQQHSTTMSTAINLASERKNDSFNTFIQMMTHIICTV